MAWYSFIYKLLNLLFRRPLWHKSSTPVRQKREKFRIEALRNLKALARKKNKKEIVSSMSVILRKFFKDYFAIRYSFTEEELSDELNRRRIDPYLKRKTQRILGRISETKYHDESSDEEIKTLLADAEELLQLL